MNQEFRNEKPDEAIYEILDKIAVDPSKIGGISSLNNYSTKSKQKVPPKYNYYKFEKIIAK